MSTTKAGRFGRTDLDLHRDDRGWVVNPFDDVPAGARATNCHIISIEPGRVRGRHVHPGRDEHFIALAGDITVCDLETGFETVISGSEPVLLVVPRGVPHSFENRGDSVAVAICFSAVIADPTLQDTIRIC
jgi:mannose-6-phosphate isomerase-like protein (cupin superfamily)